MSIVNYTSFFEETQNYFTYGLPRYVPIGYPTPGCHCELIPKRTHQICPVCECGVTYVHEYKKRKIHGGTLLGTPVTFDMTCIRYICSRCGTTFMDKYDFLPCHHTITAETENYIIWALGSTPMSAIAAEIGVSVQTIANRANEFGRREREISVDGHYKRLSMDEIFIGRDKNGNHVVYWVLNDTSVPWKSNNILINRGRGETEIIERLKRLKHPETVEAVSVDMWRPYVQAVEEVFPNAAPVIDRFHVIKAAEESVNKARLSSKRSKEEKDAMKKDASLFLSSMYKLSDDELARLDGYLKADKRLETVYFLVQELLEFYYIKDYDSALEYLCSWETEVLQSGIDLPIYHTVLNWLPYIMNYFRFRITNGKMEGRNNLIRQIDRMGFHYKLDSLQGCLYAHDRRQEYIKWRKYLKRQYIKDKERMDTNSANMIQSEVA